MDILPIALITIVTFGLGIIAGLLLADLRHTNNLPPPREATQKKLKQFARLWVDDKNETVLLEIEGKIFHHINELSATQKRKLFDSGLLSSQESDSIPIKGESPIGSPPSVVQIPTNEDSFVSNSILNQSETDLPTFPTPTPTPPKKSMFDLLSRSTQSPPRLARETPKSIAAQVDEILQSRIQGTELEQRAIRLMELPGKGMVVMIGLEQYNSVNDVPDPEIQTILRAAVREWEDKMLSNNL